jgi:hypothetical protein
MEVGFGIIVFDDDLMELFERVERVEVGDVESVFFG